VGSRKFTIGFILGPILCAGITGCSAVGSSASTSANSTSSGFKNVSNPFNGQPFILGALGDSISRGFDIADLDSEDVPENWSTGDSLPNSIINQARTLFMSHGWSVNSSSQNLAVVGDTVLGSGSTLQSGASQLAAVGAQVVTIEIGANDVCQGNLAAAGSSSQFENAVVSALRTMLNGPRPPAVIALASIPNIWNLTQIPSFSGSSYCQAAWELLCPNLSIGQSEFETQWAAANQALAAAAAQFPASVTYDNGAVANTQFTAADVSSLDCFHPSITGQEILASTVWGTVQGKMEAKW
jgi:lysophospholipase L1-like esterase